LQHQIAKQQQETAQKANKNKENFPEFKWLALNTLKKFVDKIILGVGGKVITN